MDGDPDRNYYYDPDRPVLLVIRGVSWEKVKAHARMFVLGGISGIVIGVALLLAVALFVLPLLWAYSYRQAH